MRKCFVVIAAAIAVMLAAGPAAYADLVANTTTTDITTFGFGVVPPTLTLQASGQEVPLESGCSMPPGSGGQGSPCSGVSPFNVPERGSTLGQGVKNTLVTLASININNNAQLFNLGLLFNTNEPNSSPQVTVQSLTLGIFNGTTLLGTFSLPNPVDFLQIAQGQGQAGFTIGITAAQVTAFEAAHPTFNPNWTLGLVAVMGCTLANTANCDVAGQFGVADGAESFTAANLKNPVPEPATLLLLGGGLIGLGIRRLRKM